MRRSLITVAVLAVTGTLLLPATSNVAADTLPDVWRPYLWLAWPLGMLLAAPMIYLEVRERRQSDEYHSGTVVDHEERLGRAAHDLAEAVRRQWTKEAGRRSLRSPEPIRVRWSSTGRPAGAELSKVLTGDAVDGRPLRLRGDVRQVADVFRQVDARQLVILGAPAAGKSVLALLLTLGLLPDEPVPVLLAVSSWNPHREDLHRWVARRIVEEYPALANSGRYGPDAARRLVDDGRVVPVLDGLDEMSDALQPVALDAIDRAVLDQYPLVVTCRSAEYRDAVDRNGRFLAHAAVLEIQPVSIEDAMGFLGGADPHPERWQPILDHLTVHPDGPLARALRSPLMIDLARTIYTIPGARPADLCDGKRFPDQGSIERHLFDMFLRVAYDSRSAAPGSQPGSALARYSAERAGDWLRFLAVHLNRLGDHNLAWWQVENTVSRPIRGVVPGLAVGVTFGTMQGLLFGAASGLASAAILFIAVGFAGSFGRTRRPSRIRIKFRGNEGPLLRRIVTSIALGICYIPLFGRRDAVAVSFVFIVAFSTYMWLDDPPDEASAASPMSMLRQDRGAAFALGVALILIFGPMHSLTSSGQLIGMRDGIAVVALGMTISVAVGAMLGGFLYGRIGAIAAGIAGAGNGWVTYSISYPELEHLSHLPYLTHFAAHIVLGLLLGSVAVLSRAWGAFTLTRLYLALRGQLPLRLMRFLDDAHRRGILRQSGTVYQFRHRALQEWLANPEPNLDAHPPAMETPVR
jgi:hypothetical protein